MNLSVKDIEGELLVVSNFTLYANAKKGTRPSFTDSLKPDQARILYEKYIALLKQSGLGVQTGEFGADMQVNIVNDGPVTIILDTEEMEKK